MKRSELLAWTRWFWYCLREFFRFSPVFRYILVNDSGIFYSALSKREQRIFVSVLACQHDDSAFCLEAFVRQMRDCRFYAGQPVSVLVGGSHCFHKIEWLSKGPASEKSQQIDWLDRDNAILRFLYFKDSRNRRMIYYAGIRKDLHTAIWNKFIESGILIQDFLPVTLFILENWLQKKNGSSLVVKFPGQVVWLINSDRLSIVEKCFNAEYIEGFSERVSNQELLMSESISTGVPSYYSCFSEDRKSESYTVTSLDELLHHRSLEIRRKRTFFNCGSRHRYSDILLPISTALRLSALVAVALALLFILAGFSLKTLRTDSETTINSYQHEYEQKTKLETDITILEKKLNESPFRNNTKTSFAAAMSIFCQKRPDRLYLKEINVNHVQENRWFLNAEGLTEKESSAFSYKECVGQYSKNLPLEITLLKRVNNQYRVPGQSEKPSYSFKMRLTLGQFND